MTDEEKYLKSLIKINDADIREMCVTGIELMILKEDDIKYMCDSRMSKTSVMLYYHNKIREMR